MPGASAAGHHLMARMRTPLRVLALLGLSGSLAATNCEAQLADALCDPTQSSGDTCVIVGSPAVPANAQLTFTAPNVRVQGSLHALLVGRCSLAPGTTCAADPDCAPGSCVRTATLALVVAGHFSLDAGARVDAIGRAAPGDAVGPAGGTITVTARDVDVAGTISVETIGRSSPAVPAGRAGEIVVNATGAVTLASTAQLDASTSAGGCGGSVSIGVRPSLPATIDVAKGATLTVEAASMGGTIELEAGARVTVAGTLQASNTSGDHMRPRCNDGQKGGGRIDVAADHVQLTGNAGAQGNEAGGGTVVLEGESDVSIDSSVGITSINVSGGDVDAFTSGGFVRLRATGGNVSVRGRTINAAGQSAILGSDAGVFVILASGVKRCQANDAPCSADTECAPGDTCRDTGGDVLVEAPLSAAGGGRRGFGCAGCEIQGTGAVQVSGAVDVRGGRLGGGDGDLLIEAGGDLTVGPGSIRADGGSGGAINLVAGERAGTGSGVGGTLRIAKGTQLVAVGSPFGGTVRIEGCDVAMEANVGVSVDAGAPGVFGHLDVIAHQALSIEPLVTFSALPDGEVTLSYRTEATVDPQAVFKPPLCPSSTATCSLLEMDPTLAPCPVCGDGVPEGLEECDGPGTCPAPAECLPPGAPGQCTCTVTCGNGTRDPGEQCDGADLGGETCVSRGFPGGVLACDADCEFDTSGCTAAVCGDGLVAAGEVCDPGGIAGSPPNLGGKTCQSLGFSAGGSLVCLPDCTAVVTSPHCSLSVALRCRTADDCPAAESCVAGCVQCGNGFVDIDEECDEGAANGNAPDHCRASCRLPSCGDTIVDSGEKCDRGGARCVGGTSSGASCCTQADCPGGECSGGDCSANRDDVAGCCRCDCTVASCGALDCDDGEACTVDSCEPLGGCRHQVVDYETAGDAVAEGFSLRVCVGERLPPTIERLLDKARGLIARAANAPRPKRAAHLVARAEQRLRTAAQKARKVPPRRLSSSCAQALGDVIGNALARAGCLAPGG